MGRTSRARKTRKSEPSWAALADEELLDLPLKKLKVSLKGTWAEECVREVNSELAERGIVVRAHAWLSDEWFSAQHTPGIAVPFYLAHPRLMRLERKMMLEVEGGTKAECMRLLRHEAGHVVQHAYALQRRKKWQQLFGRSSAPYPDHYTADPTSKDYVQHLRRWYAQCHPDEDFAETFAVWLTPRATWKRRYADWPALKKLEYIDEVMDELAGKKPLPQKRENVDPISTLKGTLRDHYHAKRLRYEIDTPHVFDRDLKRIFTDEPRHKNAPPAATVIKSQRSEIIRSVARWTGEYPIALDAALDDMAHRARALKLRAPGSKQRLKLDITAMLSSKAVTTHYSSSRRQWFAV